MQTIGWQRLCRLFVPLWIPVLGHTALSGQPLVGNALGWRLSDASRFISYHQISKESFSLPLLYPGQGEHIVSAALTGLRLHKDQY
jgi:hypothetical protein